MASENDKIAFRLAVNNGTEEQKNQARNLAAAYELSPQRLRSQIYKLKEERKSVSDYRRKRIDFEIAQKEAELKRVEEDLKQEDSIFNIIKGIFGLWQGNK